MLIIGRNSSLRHLTQLPQRCNALRQTKIQKIAVSNRFSTSPFIGIATNASRNPRKHSLFQIVITSTSLLVLNNSTIKCDDDGDDNDNTLNKIINSVKDSMEKGDYGTILDTAATHLGSQVQGIIDSGMPSQISYGKFLLVYCHVPVFCIIIIHQVVLFVLGFVCGFCSGYALKKAGRGAAIVFGMFNFPQIHVNQYV